MHLKLDIAVEVGFLRIETYCWGTFWKYLRLLTHGVRTSWLRSASVLKWKPFKLKHEYFRRREGERKWIAAFCGWFVLSTLFLSLYVSFFSSLESLQAQDGNSYSYHKTMQQKMWTSKRPDPFFSPIQHMGLGTLAMWPCLKISSSDFCDFFCGKQSPILRHTLELQSYVARSRCSKFYLKSRSCFFLSFTWHFPATFKRQAVRQDAFFVCFLECLLPLAQSTTTAAGESFGLKKSKEPVPFARSFWHHQGVLKRCSRIWPLSLLGNLACTSDSNPHYFQEFAEGMLYHDFYVALVTGKSLIPIGASCLKICDSIFGRRTLILDAVSDDFWMMLVCYQKKACEDQNTIKFPVGVFFPPLKYHQSSCLVPFAGCSTGHSNKNHHDTIDLETPVTSWDIWNLQNWGDSPSQLFRRISRFINRIKSQRQEKNQPYN